MCVLVRIQLPAQQYMDETTLDVSKRNVSFRAAVTQQLPVRTEPSPRSYLLCRRAPHRLAPVDLETRRFQQLVPRSCQLSWRHRDDPAIVRDEQKTQITASHGQSPFLCWHMSQNHLAGLSRAASKRSAAQGSPCGTDLVRRIPAVPISSSSTIVSESLYSLIQAAISTGGTPIANVASMIPWRET